MITTKFFQNCTCLEELKKEYKRLCFLYHPDVSTEANAGEIMKQVNNEYQINFEELKNVFKTAKGEIYTSKKTVSECPTDFINILNELIKLKGITIELMGRWIWVTGNTKENKDTLKKLKFRYCGKKKAWSWHRAEDSTMSRGKYTLQEIRDTYGSETIVRDTNTTLIA